MKKLNYLLLAVLLLVVGLVSVNAEENPITDLRGDTVNSMTLYTYEEGASVIMLDDKEAIVDVIDIINQKSLPTTQGGLGGTNIPYIDIRYSTSVVKVEFYGGNAIVIDGVTYSSDYNGDVYESIKSIFKLQGYSNPSTDTKQLVDLLNVEVEAETGNAGSSLNMTVTMPKGYGFENDASYYVKFVNDGDAKPTDYPENVFGDIDVDADDITKWKSIYKNDGTVYSNKVSIGYDWYMLNGYNYAYFLMCNNDTCTISEKPIKVDRPALPELTQRYHVFVFADELNTIDVFPYFPYLSGKNGSHKLNVKIGIIDDEKLLSSVLKRENDAFENLMKYAKNNDGTVYSKIDSEFRDVSLKDFKVKNGAYYYIYTTYEDNDGIYRDLSDITIAKGESDMLVNDIEWNPSTGDTNVIAFVTGALLLVGVAMVSYKKTKID